MSRPVRVRIVPGSSVPVRGAGADAVSDESGDVLEIYTVRGTLREAKAVHERYAVMSAEPEPNPDAEPDKWIARRRVMNSVRKVTRG